MAKAYYLSTANFTPKGIKAIVKQPQKREEAARKKVKEKGGKLRFVLLAPGSSDIVVLSEFEGGRSTAAVTKVVGAAGRVTNVATRKLQTFSQFAKAMRKAARIAKGKTSPRRKKAARIAKGKASPRRKKAARIAKGKASPRRKKAARIAKDKTSRRR